MSNSITDFLTTLNNFRNEHNNDFNMKDLVNWGTYYQRSCEHPASNPHNQIKYVYDNMFSNGNKIHISNGNDVFYLDPKFILSLDSVKKPIIDPIDITEKHVLCSNQESKDKLFSNFSESIFSEYIDVINEFKNVNEKNMIIYFYNNPKLLNLIGNIGYFLLNFNTTNTIKINLIKKLIKKLDTAILSYIPFDNQKTLLDIFQNISHGDQTIAAYNCLRVYLNCWHIIYKTTYGHNIITELNQKLNVDEQIQQIQKETLCINDVCVVKTNNNDLSTIESVYPIESEVVVPKIKNDVKDLLGFIHMIDEFDTSDGNIYIIGFCLDFLIYEEINQIIELENDFENVEDTEELINDMNDFNDMKDNIKLKKHGVCLFVPSHNNEKFLLTNYIFQNIEGIQKIDKFSTGIDIDSTIPDLAQYIKELKIIEYNIESLISVIKIIKQFLHIR